MYGLPIDFQIGGFQKNINKPSSIPPRIWGHSAWKFFFSIAYVYPVSPDRETMENYYIYFTHLKTMLPCEKCQHHYQIYLKKYPLQNYLGSREMLFKWLLGLHNQSNQDSPITDAPKAIKRYLPQLDPLPEKNSGNNWCLIDRRSSLLH